MIRRFHDSELINKSRKLINRNSAIITEDCLVIKIYDEKKRKKKKKAVQLLA